MAYFIDRTSEEIHKLTKNWTEKDWEHFRSQNDYWVYKDRVARLKLDPETNSSDLDRRFRAWKLKLIKKYV